MKVLITGISGLLGNAVARHAINRDYEVTGLIRQHSMITEELPVEYRIQDLTAAEFDKDLLDDIDVVIHCAANTSMGSISDKEQDRINVMAVQKLVESAERSKVRKFIFISSANTIRPGSGKNPTTEEARLAVSRWQLNYINSKIKAEEIVRQAASNRGLDTVILNPTFIIGPHRGYASSNRLLGYALKYPVIFYPPGGKDIVNSEDVARAAVDSIDKGRTGENYLLSDQIYSFREIFRLVNRKSGRKVLMVPVPGFIILLPAMIFSLIEQMIRKPMNFNVLTAILLNSRHHYSSAKARSDLDFKPVPFPDALEEILKKIQNEL